MNVVTIDNSGIRRVYGFVTWAVNNVLIIKVNGRKVHKVLSPTEQIVCIR